MLALGCCDLWCMLTVHSSIREYLSISGIFRNDLPPCRLLASQAVINKLLANAVMYDLCIVRYTFSSIFQCENFQFLHRLHPIWINLWSSLAVFHPNFIYNRFVFWWLLNFDLVNIYFLELRRIQYN